MNCKTAATLLEQTEAKLKNSFAFREKA